VKVRRLMIITVVSMVGSGTVYGQPGLGKSGSAFIVRPGFANERLSPEWRNAIESRMAPRQLDSVMALSRSLHPEELEWKSLIESKAARWGLMRDSLGIPFGNETLDDTLSVIVGYMGRDDGFTYRYEAVCLDLTALHREYGSAALPENFTRIDRLFAHEFMHLLHKDWARRRNLRLESFRDSVLWECIYEGIGMYRSLSSKWLPTNGVLPEISRSTLEDLYSVFVERLTTIESNGTLTEEEKTRLHNGLSRGPVNKKWGALPVGLWLALEAGGDDKNLIPWIDGGLDSVIRLAKKHLTGDSRKKFLQTFSD